MYIFYPPPPLLLLIAFICTDIALHPSVNQSMFGEARGVWFVSSPGNLFLYNLCVNNVAVNYNHVSLNANIDKHVVVGACPYTITKEKGSEAFISD